MLETKKIIKLFQNHQNQITKSRYLSKYPYSARLFETETEDYLSDKICRYTIKTRQKIVRQTKRLLVYGELIIALGNGLVPIQAVGLPILRPSIIRSINSNSHLSKKAIIAEVIQDMSGKMIFTETEMDQLYNISMKFKNNSLSEEELITTINNLRVT